MLNTMCGAASERFIDRDFALQKEPASEYAPMVVNNGPLYGTSDPIEGGVVNPGPIAFESGEVKGFDDSMASMLFVVAQKGG